MRNNHEIAGKSITVWRVGRWSIVNKDGRHALLSKLPLLRYKKITKNRNKNGANKTQDKRDNNLNFYSVLKKYSLKVNLFFFSESDDATSFQCVSNDKCFISMFPSDAFADWKYGRIDNKHLLPIRKNNSCRHFSNNFTPWQEFRIKVWIQFEIRFFSSLFSTILLQQILLWI